MPNATDVMDDSSRFLRLVNALDHAIVWEFDDTAQRYTFVSDHSRLVLGYDATQWLADPHRLERCIVPDDLEGFLELLSKLRNGVANDLRMEHRCMTAEGNILWMHTGVHCAFEHGSCIFRGVSLDIHGVKSAEERERKARQEAEDATHNLEEILAIVSHDVRTPLNSLMLAVTLLQQKHAGDKDAVKLSASIARSVSQVARLLDDLIDTASIRERRLRLVATETTTETIVREAIESLAAEAAEKGVALQNTESASTTVRCDPKRIAQVLSNLLSNGVKFTPSGGTVMVSVEADALEVKFSVRDTGPGIPAEDIAKVFERHWQAPETAAQGRGLGLFIAKGIVDAHAGRIWAESSLGSGTTFMFALPRAT